MTKSDLFRYTLLGLESIAAISGFIAWKKIKFTYWKWFPIYLAIIAFTELLCEFYIQHIDQRLHADIFFYFAIPMQFLFFFWLLNQYENVKGKNKLALVSATIYLISLLTDQLYFRNASYWFFSFSYTIGNILLLILILRLLYKLIRSDEIITFKENMMFWVGTGIMIFYLGSLPYYGMLNTLSTVFGPAINIYWYIQIILNCIMYFLFTMSFIWGKPK
jgi:hypothetical protein